MGLTNKIENNDKRRHERIKCEAVIEWSYFNQDVYFDARLINFGRNGVYFETDRELKPGVSILLRTKRISPSMTKSKDHQHPRSVSLGEVQWCLDLSGRDKSCYGVGVRFPFPY
jgi:hypothetical protein